MVLLVSFSSFILLPLHLEGLLPLVLLQCLLRPLHPRLSYLLRHTAVLFSSFSLLLFLLQAQAMVVNEQVPPHHRRSWGVGRSSLDGTRRTKC